MTPFLLFYGYILFHSCKSRHWVPIHGPSPERKRPRLRFPSTICHSHANLLANCHEAPTVCHTSSRRPHDLRTHDFRRRDPIATERIGRVGRGRSDPDAREPDRPEQAGRIASSKSSRAEARDELKPFRHQSDSRMSKNTGGSPRSQLTPFWSSDLVGKSRVARFHGCRRTSDMQPGAGSAVSWVRS